MPVKNEGDATDGEDVSGAESEHSNSSQGRESTDEEANEMDSDDSSEMDAIEMERIRSEHVEDLASLELQFDQLRELYYQERNKQNEQQIADVRSGRSEEYLIPLRELDKAFRNRVEVADKLRKFRLENIEHKYQSEEQAALQHFESEKQLLLDQMEEEIIEKIRRLEEDRNNVDISWSDWAVDRRASKVRGPGRKKAVTVTGPYIVYMLRDEDIMEDWTTIRKALKRSAATAVASVAI
ncbi:PREDICTED: breast cancer metastasis-suppressor 1-like protein [Rhagoletis zephyria]|uniref:breast cancer metastasis-suppressor 1-like protein n=1 Tax=Rhagoletis zephyria TaxID=28612 RepID=UPI0008113C0D|nr:PREDICTED: breast cancer metastasis-suppressor 1-like protein [Rhagoletis zephyria]XP_017466955.1 PREDICTED: breast cancer metastasis-suppressor 1-like protein [Rhagoletis zephyria]XP_017466956.1 PREDICTED: breast cancer metastasis-suppressor 1-like protein [Rhagoletis zephyria]XP_036346746.1 breast cancer metastasis-suppressor 1-like protein [Rhagoletis pomonella]XP_036346747.1 breast cancer metastasis-suppressor 1-like protein [Rhagoletis pomonella]XP_036346754.1 breast cancer metastasis-